MYGYHDSYVALLYGAELFILILERSILYSLHMSC